jgi:hypothetical protein
VQPAGNGGPAKVKPLGDDGGGEAVGSSQLLDQHHRCIGQPIGNMMRLR